MRFRLTQAEHAELQEAARAAGVEIGAYARAQALTPPENRGSAPHETTRPQMVPFRVTPEERAQIEDAADRAGLSTGSYVRARALQRAVTLTTRRPPVERTELARLLGLMGKVGGNLHQLVRGLNFGRTVPLVDARDAIAGVEAAAAEIIRTLGRRPG